MNGVTARSWVTLGVTLRTRVVREASGRAVRSQSARCLATCSFAASTPTRSPAHRRSPGCARALLIPTLATTVTTCGPFRAGRTRPHVGGRPRGASRPIARKRRQAHAAPVVELGERPLHQHRYPYSHQAGQGVPLLRGRDLARHRGGCAGRCAPGWNPAGGARTGAAGDLGMVAPPRGPRRSERLRGPDSRRLDASGVPAEHDCDRCRLSKRCETATRLRATGAERVLGPPGTQGSRRLHPRTVQSGLRRVLRGTQRDRGDARHRVLASPELHTRAGADRSRGDGGSELRRWHTGEITLSCSARRSVSPIHPSVFMEREFV